MTELQPNYWQCPVTVAANKEMDRLMKEAIEKVLDKYNSSPPVNPTLIITAL